MGESALESFQAAPPAVIILDLRLPKLSGSDLCKEVKAQAPALPIVVLSATSDVSDKVLSARAWCGRLRNQAFQPQGTSGARTRSFAAYFQNCDD